MQLGLVRPSLTPEERRRLNNLCLYCVKAGHYEHTCPAKLRKCLSVSSVNQPNLSVSSAHIALHISLQLSGRIVSVTAIIDSGACSCFIDLFFAAQQHIPLQPKE